MVYKGAFGRKSPELVTNCTKIQTDLLAQMGFKSVEICYNTNGIKELSDRLPAGSGFSRDKDIWL